MINNLISVEFCHALSLAMIHSLWQGIAVVFILWMLDFFHLVRQPKNNYALHYFFMLLLLAGFIINILFGIQDINTTNSMNEFSPTFANSPGNNLSSAISGFITDWQYWLGISWFMGFLFFSLRSIWGTVQVYNLKSISKPVNNEWVVKVKEMSRKLNYQGKV